MAEERFSLRQVVEITGICEFTLRGWENRYKAFKPRRSQTGRRQYSTLDIEKSVLLQQLIQKGHRIRRIAHLSCIELKKILQDQREVASSSLKDKSSQMSDELKNIFACLEKYSWRDLDSSISQVRRKIGNEKFIFHFILPLLQEMGRLNALGQFSIAQEHLLSALIKEQLQSVRLDLLPRKSKKSKFLFMLCTPPGDHHDVGLLIVSLILTLRGYDVIYLGPNLPSRDLCESAFLGKVTHVILSSTISKKEGAKEDLYSYINYLDKHLQKNMKVWVGGRNASQIHVQSKREIFVIPSLVDFDQKVKSL